MRKHEFREKLKEGQQAENILKERLHSILFAESVKLIKWEGKDIFSTNLQRKGVDGTLRFKEVRWESKVRDYSSYKYGDILLETISVVKDKKPGWFYYTIADFVIYTWKNKKGTKLIDGYFIFVQNPILKSWFKENEKRFRLVRAKSYDKKTGEYWYTLNRAVPISQFPKGTVLRLDANIPLINQKEVLDKILDGSFGADRLISDSNKSPVKARDVQFAKDQKVPVLKLRERTKEKPEVVACIKTIQSKNPGKNTTLPDSTKFMLKDLRLNKLKRTVPIYVVYHTPTHDCFNVQKVVPKRNGKVGLKVVKIMNGDEYKRFIKSL